MSNVSKLDYLQKYLSDNDPKKKKQPVKKKKKIKKVNQGNLKIIDNDISLSKIKRQNSDDYEFEDEKPLIFAEGGALLQDELKRQEEEKQRKWKSMNNKHQGIDDRTTNDSISTRLRNDSSSDSDASPPRNKSSRGRVRHDSSDSDLSPVRDQNQRQDDSDISPPRKSRQDSDSDISPPRKSKHYPSDSDVSPPRKRNKNHKHRKEELPEIIKKPGLRTGSELREENKFKKMREKELFDSMDKSLSGKGAETVHRDRKTGKKLDLKFEEMKKRKEEEQRLEDLEQYRKWGKGLAQEKNQQEKVDDDLREMQKPLARYKDDSDLDHMLRKQDRDGDPMLAYLSKKKNSVSNKPSKPRYSGPMPPPNRFNIMPGYRYDGVDRSNGFEKKRYLAMSSLKTLKNDAYKWSTEDM